MTLKTGRWHRPKENRGKVQRTRKWKICEECELEFLFFSTLDLLSCEWVSAREKERCHPSGGQTSVNGDEEEWLKLISKTWLREFIIVLICWIISHWCCSQSLTTTTTSRCRCRRRTRRKGWWCCVICEMNSKSSAACHLAAVIQLSEPCGPLGNLAVFDASTQRWCWWWWWCDISNSCRRSNVMLRIICTKQFIFARHPKRSDLVDEPQQQKCRRKAPQCYANDGQELFTKKLKIAAYTGSERSVIAKLTRAWKRVRQSIDWWNYYLWRVQVGLRSCWVECQRQRGPRREHLFYGAVNEWKKGWKEKEEKNDWT